MYNFLGKWQGELKRTFTGTPDAVPDWVTRLADGDDAGYFLPGSAVWAVHGGMPTIVAGIRALLMQALHPGALAGVHDHSRFREDPLGRLAGTIQWVFTVSYGSTDAAQAASDWVRGLHEHVRGEYLDGSGRSRSYAANDPELLRWVHIAFADAFLTAHKLWGGRIPGGPDAYVREWSRAGLLMGVESPPLSEKDMRQQLDRWYDNGELCSDERVAETVAFIRNPPLHPVLRVGYRMLFAAAVTSLEPKYRSLLGLKSPQLGPIPLPINFATRVTLGVVHLALGRMAPSEQAARERLRRLANTEPRGSSQDETRSIK
ncbi:uncharacterized protein (DUF2236 family) [Arthrobacter sp. SLBN-100]|uniref:oxygenase MpaB family protein n=1 Tax=Arthrobacter sp. SLBN-100 TaxID=2768450 RepID=UPI00115038F6|nr:oxygenase MpaB family protein [Arthrobacter sp. SLBN-100]TQJ62141.1 uncharacterized protein (DUF2236 family) [Arthrobacter sp. SLBN-100]